jgi:hypothetical protein
MFHFAMCNVISFKFEHNCWKLDDDGWRVWALLFYSFAANLSANSLPVWVSKNSCSISSDAK